jgi:type II secretory pathway pseudopilin PulG
MLRQALSMRGLSLVEVTIMLAILLVLAGALVPVVSDSVNSARLVRARNDLSQLAAAVTAFQRDVGPFVFDGSQIRRVQTLSSLRVVDVLRSGGDMPAPADAVPPDETGTIVPAPSVDMSGAALTSWIGPPTLDGMDNHLRVNGRNYPVSPLGSGNGWNGPYVSRLIAGDPWGHSYLANIGFLKGTPPTPGRCRDCAVFILSAGPNGLLETPFQQPITNANVFGDDLAVRIQ